MAIDLDKILTISAREYVESKNKSLSDYDFRGVHACGSLVMGSTDSSKGKLVKKVPEDAEIVTDYKLSLAGIRTVGFAYEANATALIPKKG